MPRKIVVIGLIAVLAGATATSRAQIAVPDTTSAGAADTLRAIVVEDSIGIPGTLKGKTDYDPVRMKETLGRMGSSEVAGRTAWQRKKNPRTAMICSALLPGLGQTYNGRRLKVGVVVGFASFYMGNMALNWKRYEAYALEGRLAQPGSREAAQAARLADFYKEEARTFLWWSGAVWLIGLLDSWIDAHLYDVREYTPPRPPDDGVPRPAGGEASYMTLGIGLSFR